MNRYQTQARLACQISIGLMAGVFSIVPVVQASPVQDAASIYNQGGVTVVPGTVTKVTSTTQNNIVAWKDFSVAQGEKVQFDGGSKANNYLNVVTGNATSQIAGTIEGGKDVYLVNPHGVIFSRTAQVDVGNLYVSTQDAASAVNAYQKGSTGGAVLQAGTAQADVVNLGKIAADKVEADGTHIRFLNSADVTAPSGVVLNAAGDDAYVHVGNAGGTDAGYTSTKGTTIDYYQLVSNATELQNIKNDLGKNYMLSEDIDASGIANFTPIGDSTTPFSGKFDGMFYEVKNLNVNTANDAGLFGDVKGVSAQSARIENFGLKNATIVSVKNGVTYTNADNPVTVSKSSRFGHMFDWKPCNQDLDIDHYSNTSKIGVGANGEDVYTADGKNAISYHAKNPGLDGQIAGLTIRVEDSEGNPKKSINRIMDNFTETIRAQDPSPDNAMTFQVGTKANQSIRLGFTDMRSYALGLASKDGKAIDISSQVSANAAISAFDNAVEKVLAQQTTLGAVTSRMDYTNANIVTASENVTASKSVISDADMAKEMTSFTKNNILTQAAQSMLAQANQSSSSVLSLLQ